MTRTRATAAAVVLTGLLAACGGGSKAPDASGTTGTTTAGKGAASGLPLWDENRKMNDSSGYSSPLGKAMGYDVSNQDQAAEQARYRERELKRQEAVAECMRAQGFTYTPYVSEQSFSAFMPPAYELTRKEFVEKYGFGISTMTEEMNKQPENMPKPEDDPNFTYQQSLPQSDQEAYQKALYGDQPMMDPAAGDGGDGTTETTAMEYKPSGCSAKGDEALNGVASDADKTFMEDFNKRLETLYQKVQADKRVVDANRAYATCMADKGFPEIDKQETAYQKVSEKMQPLYESMGGGVTSVGGAAPATIAVGGAIPVEGDDGTGGPKFDPAKLAEVKTYELGVAKADLACGKDVMRIGYEVNVELEQQFVDENAADLSRYKDLNDRGAGGMG
jgi:hypothetical protein